MVDPIAHKKWMAFGYMVKRNLVFLSHKLVKPRYRKVVDLLLLLHEHQVHVIPVFVKPAHHLLANYHSGCKVIPDCYLGSQLVQKVSPVWKNTDRSDGQWPQLSQPSCPLLFHLPGRDGFSHGQLGPELVQVQSELVFQSSVIVQLILNRFGISGEIFM